MPVHAARLCRSHILSKNQRVCGLKNLSWTIRRQLDRCCALTEKPLRDESGLDKITAERLKAIREYSGLSQPEFAKRLGVSVRTYRNYEHGVRSMPQSVRYAVVRWYGNDPLPTDALLTLLNRGPAAPLPKALSWADVRAVYVKNLAARYPGAGRRVITIRNHVYAAAGIYGFVGTVFFDAEQSFDALDPVRAGLLKASVVICATISLWIVSEFPLGHMARYVTRRKCERRATDA